MKESRISTADRGEYWTGSKEGYGKTDRAYDLGGFEFAARSKDPGTG